MLVLTGIVSVGSASMGAAHFGRHGLAGAHVHAHPRPADVFPSSIWARGRRPRAEDCFDAMFDGDFDGAGEVPGARPFTPEPDEHSGARTGPSCPEVAGHVEGGHTGAYLPPSALWAEKRIPEGNTLAHMKLLGELDGQPIPAIASSREQKRDSSLIAGVGPDARDAWQTSTGLMNYMVPFGAPSREDDGHGILVEGQAVPRRENQVGGIVGDEGAHPGRLSPGVGGSAKMAALSPVGKVDAKVRDYVARARFSAGHKDGSLQARGDDCPGAPASTSVWSGDATGMMAGSQCEDAEGACPGSPVSSMWSQDPCGYWVQEAMGEEDLPADFDLGYYCDLPGPSNTGSGPTPLPIRRDGSSGDLWSTVEGDDAVGRQLDLGQATHSGGGDGVQLQHESALGVRAPPGQRGQSGNCDQWCDKFVPRPLQHEFARELRWFAWQGRESAEGEESSDAHPALSTPRCSRGEEGSRNPEVHPALSTPAAASATNAPTAPSRKQLPHPAPFSLSLPFKQSLPTMLPPFNLPLRHAFPIQTTVGIDHHTGGSDGLETADYSDMADERIESGHVSRKSAFMAKKNGNKGLGGKPDGGAVGVQKRSWSSSCPTKPQHCAPPRSQQSVARSQQSKSAPGRIMSARSESPDSTSQDARRDQGAAAANGELELKNMEMLVVGQDGNVGGAAQQDGNMKGAGRLDEVQIFKIREMLQEMHRALVSQAPSLVATGGYGTAAAAAAQTCPRGWDGSGDALMWRLTMYNAMMHAQARVAAAGHASVRDGVAILDRMTSVGVPPSLQTFNRHLAVVAGAASHGRGNGTHAADALARMAQAGIAPSRETYWSWLSVLGSAVYYGQASMQEVYWALQSINQESIDQSAPWREVMRDASGPAGAEGEGRMLEEDITCLQLCLRAAVGGAHRGLAGKQDVDWVLRRLRSLQLDADHETWALAMQVLVIAAQRGDATLADAQRLLEQAENAGYAASPTLYCAFFQAAAAVANRYSGSRHRKQILDVRERVVGRLRRLEHACRSAPNLQQSLLPLTQAVRQYVDQGLGSPSDGTTLRKNAGRALGRV